MKFALINSLSGMDALSQRWDGLLKESASRVPFLQFQYLRSWWETRGGGEWGNCVESLGAPRRRSSRAAGGERRGRAASAGVGTAIATAGAAYGILGSLA